jgi:hypothetical protein
VIPELAGCQTRQLAFKGWILSVQMRGVFAVVRLPRNWMKSKIVMSGSTSHIGRCGGVKCLKRRSQTRQIPKNLSY